MPNRKEAEGKQITGHEPAIRKLEMEPVGSRTETVLQQQKKRSNRSAIAQDAEALYCPFEVSNPQKTCNSFSIFTTSKSEQLRHCGPSQKNIRYSTATLQQILHNIPEQQLRDYACKRWDGLKDSPFVSDPDMRCPFWRQLCLWRNRENAERRQFASLKDRNHHLNLRTICLPCRSVSSKGGGM